VDGPKKQTIAHNERQDQHHRQTVPPHTIDREHAGEDTDSSSSQNAVANARTLSLYEG